MNREELNQTFIDATSSIKDDFDRDYVVEKGIEVAEQYAASRCAELFQQISKRSFPGPYNPITHVVRMDVVFEVAKPFVTVEK